MRKKEQKILLLVVIGLVIILYMMMDKNSLLWQCDLAVVKIMHGYTSNKVLTGVMNWISDYTLASLVGIGFVGLYLLYDKKIREFRYFVEIGLFLYLIVTLIKDAIMRLRPFEQIDFVRNLDTGLWIDRYSFPSSHTVFAFFVAYFMAEVIWRKAKCRYWIYILALLVAISRMYLGVHFLSDVLAGVMIGLSFGIILKWLVVGEKK